MQYATAAFFVNLFCFVFVQGTYLNRYLILAVIFFVPVLAVGLAAFALLSWLAYRKAAKNYERVDL